MGKLIRKGLEPESHLYLRRDHTFGRDVGSCTVLRGAKASRLHARVFYQGEAWMLRDMGSRNGTYVNGKRVPGGSAIQLKIGDTLVFGDVDESWFLLDDGRPRSMLIPVDQNAGAPIVMERWIAVPCSESPRLTIFQSDDGVWELEEEDGSRRLLQHMSSLTVEGVEYHVHLDAPSGEVAPDTRTAEVLGACACFDEMRMGIAVAPDEERAAVTLSIGAEKHQLPPRVHLYLLAYLARLRIAQTPVCSTPCSPVEPRVDLGDDYGWVDCRSACKDLFISSEHLAQMVFRIRQDFELIHSTVARGIVDRKLRGRIRIGFPASHVTVSRLV